MTQESGKLRKEVQGGVEPAGDRGLHSTREENVEFPWVLPTPPFQVLKYQKRLEVEDTVGARADRAQYAQGVYCRPTSLKFSK